MTWVAAGVASAALTYQVYQSAHNANKAKKAQKAENDAINNAPKYKISDEAYQNKNIAEGQAFGRDRSIMGQQKTVEQDAANDAGRAQQVSSSTSDLLSTIAAINTNKNNTIRGLGNDEAQIQNQKVGQLYNVNNQMIDEKDKAWNYNSNMPYQMKIAALRDEIKARREMSAKAADSASSTAISSSSAFAGSSMGSKG